MFHDGVSDFCGRETRRAYRHIFNAENYLRFVVKWELVGYWGVDWEVALGEEGRNARRQMANEARVGLIDVERANVMSYLMLSEVKKVILSDDNWPLFARRLGNRAIFETQLTLLNRLRGKAMHCRPWTADDLDTLESVLRMLSRLTQSYRDERVDADVVVDPTSADIPKTLRKELLKAAMTRSSVVPRPWRVSSYAAVGAYDKIGLALSGAAFSPEAPKRLFAGTGLDCIFVASDAATGRLELYLPRILDREVIARVMVATRGIAPIRDDVLRDDPDERIERFDGLFGISAQLPLALRLPMDD